MTIKLNSISRCLVLLAMGAVCLMSGCGRNRESAVGSGLAKAEEGQPAHVSLESSAPMPSTPPAAPGPVSGRTDPGTGSTREAAEAPAGTGPAEGRSAVSAGPTSSASPPQVTSEFYSFPKPEDVPLAPMGEQVGYSPVTKSPGYHPVDDPEADAVRRGRRLASKVDIPFTGGETSPERLAQAILDALKAEDFNVLRALRVTPDEFADIMYPEFPESRPLCNSDASTAYFFLDRTSHSGCTLGLSIWGGQDLRLLGIEYAIGRAPYTNFTLYHGVRIHVLKPNGEEGVIKFVRTFAERNGIWKVYTYKDKE
jgi:hypothetical protein